MKLILTVTGVLLFTFLFASCGVVESIEPLSPPETAKRDKRLTGVWAAWDYTEKKGCKIAFWVHFIETKDSVTDVITLWQLDELPIMFLKMHPTIIGEHNYMNLKMYAPEHWSADLAKDVDDYGYFIAKYEISGDTLRISLLEDNSEEAIRKSQLEWDRKLSDHAFTITDKPKNIIKFLQNTDHDKIFKDWGLLTKVKTVEPYLLEGNRCDKGKDTDLLLPPF